MKKINSWTTLAVLFFAFQPNTFAAKKALVYSGPGACDGCYQAAYSMALKAGFDPMYVNESDLDSSSTPEDQASLFKDAAIWLQPGGKSSTAVNAMTSELKKALVDFVAQGGGYVGFCAGAFSSTKLVGTTANEGFNFMPGKTILYGGQEDSAAILPIKWNGVVRNIYWEGGPYLTELPPGQVEPIAYYPNGQVAKARTQFGKGRVFVTGTHPEADRTWRRDYGLTDPDGDDHDLAIDMINWATATQN